MVIRYERHKNISLKHVIAVSLGVTIHLKNKINFVSTQISTTKEFLVETSKVCTLTQRERFICQNKSECVSVSHVAAHTSSLSFHIHIALSILYAYNQNLSRAGMFSEIFIYSTVVFFAFGVCMCNV